MPISHDGAVKRIFHVKIKTWKIAFSVFSVKTAWIMSEENTEFNYRTFFHNA